MEPTIYKPGAYKTQGVYKGAGGIYKGTGVYNDGAGGGGSVFYEFISDISGHTSFPKTNIDGVDWSFLSGGAKQEILTRSQLGMPENTKTIEISFDKYIFNFSTNGAHNILISFNDTNKYFFAFRNQHTWIGTSKNNLLFANGTVSQFIDTPILYNGGQHYQINSTEYIILGNENIFNTPVNCKYLIEKNKLSSYENGIKIYEAEKLDDIMELKEIGLYIEMATNGYAIKNLNIIWTN